MPETPKAPAKRVSNPEIATLASISKLMDELEGDAQARTLCWLVSTYGSPALQAMLARQQEAES